MSTYRLLLTDYWREPSYSVDAQAKDNDRSTMLSKHPIADTLRARISIAALIAETVDLVRMGDELRGQCTAHRDRERSLFVHDAKGLYQCFSCGRRGDVVQWTQETSQCGEEAALAILGQRAGIDGLDDYHHSNL